ncbi:hypothetical protein TNCV_3938851 [Trichonephila clavipes]|nr:hypothetical protein TNCV_3938851 [Trichonephila clavipes]
MLDDRIDVCSDRVLWNGSLFLAYYLPNSSSERGGYRCVRGLVLFRRLKASSKEGKYHRLKHDIYVSFVRYSDLNTNQK